MRYCDWDNCWEAATKQLLNDRDEVLAEHCSAHMDVKLERVRNKEYFRILPIKPEEKAA